MSKSQTPKAENQRPAPAHHLSLITFHCIQELIDKAYRQFGGEGTSGARVIRMRKHTMLSRYSNKQLAGMAARADAPRQNGEHDHQVAFFDILRLNEHRIPELRFIFAVPNGGHRHASVAGKLRAEGVRAGVPDIFIPIGRKGHFGAFIENKFGKNKMTPAQAEFSIHLTRNNYAFKTCYSVDEQIAFVEWYLGVELVKGNR